MPSLSTTTGKFLAATPLAPDLPPPDNGHVRDDITVVVTAHNYGRYLRACLASILDQTQRPGALIVVDDGSRDSTPEVLAELTPQLQAAFDFTVIRHPVARGNAAALNAGIRASTTPLVAHVDADDICLPRYIEAMAEALDAREDIAYVYPKLVLTGAETGIYRTFPFHEGRLIFAGNYIPNVGLMRRSAFDDTPGYRALATHVDWDLWLAMLERGHRGELVDEVLYEWRRHPGAITYQPQLVRLRTRLNVLWAHRTLVLRYAKHAVPWSWQAVSRRLRGKGESKSASGWIEDDQSTSDQH